MPDPPATAGPFRVVIFGAAHIDRLLRTREPALLGVSNPGVARDLPGGVAFNVAAALGRLGVAVALATRIGGDAAGDRVAAELAAAGVGAEGIARSSTAPTATYHAVLDPAGSLVIGVADTRIYDEIDPGHLAAALGAPANLWIADANLPAPVLAHIAAAGRARGVPLAACAVSPAKAVRFAPLLGDIAIWFGNRSEAEAVLGRPPGKDQPGELAAGLMAMGVGSGFVSDGARPFPAWTERQVETMAPFPARAVRSVNGAGDAQAAGTVYGLSRGLGFFDALRYGRAAAALKIESEAPVRGDLTPAMIESRASAGAGI